MEKFDNLENLIKRLTENGMCKGNFILGIDGVQSAGKTRLSSDLKNAFNEKVRIIEVNTG